MNKLFITLIGTALLASCQEKKKSENQEFSIAAISVTEGNVNTTNSNFTSLYSTNADSLMQFKDKYPAEIKLMDNDLLKTRLEVFLSCQEIRELKERLQTSTPIEVEGNSFFAQGCKAHDCSVNEAAIFINTRLDQIWVAIVKNKKITIKSDKAFDSNPQQLQAWMDRFNTMQ